MGDDGFDLDFDPEMADKTIRHAIQSTFDGTDGKDVDQKSLDKWTKSITDTVLKYCSQENSKCKYAVTVTMLQKVGAGFIAQNKMFWDNNGVEDGGDGFVKVAWENSALYVVVTLYAVKVMAMYSNEQIRAMNAMNINVDLH